MPDQDKDTSLTTAIEKAVESQDKSSVIVESREGKEEKEAKEVEQEEQEQEEDGEQEYVSDPDADQGRILIQALKDPQKAPLVIDFIATQAGYTKANIQTRQDVKQASNEIESILENSLGDEFKFLAPKLAPAIKQTVENLLQGHDNTSDLRARLEQQELKGIQDETARAHIELSREWFGSDEMPANVVKAMSEAIDEFTPSDPNISPARYYRKIFNLVAGELGLSKRGNQARSDRITRNRSDEVARNLSSQNRGATPTSDGNGPRRMSLKDAVSLAMEQVDQASRK